MNVIISKINIEKCFSNYNKYVNKIISINNNNSNKNLPILFKCNNSNHNNHQILPIYHNHHQLLLHQLAVVLMKVIIHRFYDFCLNRIYLVLQQLLTSPNPPKQPPTAAQNAVQARLRTVCIISK